MLSSSLSCLSPLFEKILWEILKKLIGLQGEITYFLSDSSAEPEKIFIFSNDLNRKQTS